MKPVLLAGETFHVTSFAAKGYEVGASSRYSNGAERYIKGLAAHDIAVVQIGGERCESQFPTTIEALAPYSTVVLSDVGALSLLYTPQTSWPTLREPPRASKGMGGERRRADDGGRILQLSRYRWSCHVSWH